MYYDKRVQQGCAVSKRSDQFPPAFKHGAYSGTTLLPGEDETAFKKLHGDLIGEFAPTGPLEQDIVETIARLTWRKQNLSTYRVAKWAKNWVSAIEARRHPPSDLEMPILCPDLRDQR